MKAAVAKISQSTGVPEENVTKILEQLGLPTVLEQVKDFSGRDSSSIGTSDLRVSVRVGQVFVVR